MKTVAIIAIVLLVIAYFLIVFDVYLKPPMFMELIIVIGLGGIIAAILSLHDNKG